MAYPSCRYNENGEYRLIYGPEEEHPDWLDTPAWFGITTEGVKPYIGKVENLEVENNKVVEPVVEAPIVETEQEETVVVVAKKAGRPKKNR